MQSTSLCLLRSYKLRLETLRYACLADHGFAVLEFALLRLLRIVLLQRAAIKLGSAPPASLVTAALRSVCIDVYDSAGPALLCWAPLE